MQIVGNQFTPSASRADLCTQLTSGLEQDYQVAYIVLDVADYSNDGTVLDEFRDLAFCWTPDRPTDRVPEYLRNLMLGAGSRCLVWMSRRVCDYDDKLFSWVLLHELRHVFQYRRMSSYSELRRNISNLRRQHSYINLPPSLFAPAEIDADLFALNELSPALNPFLVLPRCPLPAYNAFLNAFLADAKPLWVSQFPVSANE